MNKHFKGLGLGSKRKSSANNSSVPQVAPPLGPQISGAPPGRPGPLSTSSSASSLNTAMNLPGGGQRPPSYSAAYAPNTIANRTTSPPMPPGPGNPRTPPSQVIGGPPPINTTSSGGYPPQHGPQGPVGPPLQGGPVGPPQYVGAGYPNPAQSNMGAPVPYAARNNAVEVEGAGRSKSQLIVGIDFVSVYLQPQRRHRTNVAI